MTTNKPSEDVRAYLDLQFPGSSIDDTYYFVTFKSPVNETVSDAALDAVANHLAQNGAWLISVGVDPRAYVDTRAFEERTVLYQPDWNNEEKLIEFIAVIGRPGLDLLRLLEAETSPGAVAIVDPSRHLTFNANARRLHARDRPSLDGFLGSLGKAAGRVS